MSSPYRMATLSNGLGLVLRPMPQAQSVAVGVWVGAGGRYESSELAGVSHFLEHLLFKGTRRRSCEELKQAIEGVGGSLNGFTAEEFTCYMVKAPHRYTRRAIDVLADMVQRPRFSLDDVNKEREVILEEIRMYEDTPGQYVHDLLSQLLWPNHPLGMLLSGTIDTVRRMTRSDVARYWRRMYQPRNLLVACAGAMDPEGVSRYVRQAFGTMRGAPARAFQRAPRPRRGPQVRVWNKQTEQTHLCAGTYAVPRTHPDRFALELLHVLLGANMSSRLFREVREKRGLVYEIGTQIKRFHDTGAFIIYAGCDTGKLTATVQTIFTELSRIRRAPIARAELKRAKDYYAGQLIMGLEDTMDHMLWMGEQAVTVGRVAKPDILLGHLANVTERDVQRVARHLFLTPKMHLVVGGPVAEHEASRLADLCRVP
ncbi:MAG: insulinase family protein [Candidatus Omnitrophica bacterium]|nr:insulinase family protein [Candidatus Omnitrophota bacterium]MBI3020705.1 insulinase family protein [Candidatus Omnitrophota bacterium]